MNGVNLIPAPRRAARLAGRRLRAWIIAAIGWAGMIAGACGVTHLSFGRDQAATAAELDSTRQRVSVLNTRVSELRRTVAQLVAQRDTALAISDHPDWSILLGVLSQTTGERVVLRDISLKPVPSKLAPQLVLQLRGFTDTQPAVSQFVLRLQQLGLFDEVKLIRTGREPIQNTSAVTFEITGVIVGRSQP
jgi:Tfp pilus assembly protein PilN